MHPLAKRKRGGQIGNRNARKHGFYSRSLSTSEICEFMNITGSHGIDREIAVLRVNLKSVLEHCSAIHRVLTEAARLLLNSYCAKFHLDRLAGKSLKKAIWSMWTYLPSRSTLTKPINVKSAAASYSDKTNQTCFYLLKALPLTKAQIF